MELFRDTLGGILMTFAVVVQESATVDSRKGEVGHEDGHRGAANHYELGNPCRSDGYMVSRPAGVALLRGGV